MLNTSTLASLGLSQGAKLPASLTAGKSGDASVEKARDLQKAFGQFVGETFYGEMLKAMRTTVGEPAYFHGGMAEEQFQSRLDQQMSQDLAESGGTGLAADLFRQQFPSESELLDNIDSAKGADSTAGSGTTVSSTTGLRGLDALRRR